MIKYLETSFKNYILFDEATIPLSNQGVVFVKGVNYDENGGSNGAGKSTCMEAIQVPIFIKTSKGSKDDLVREKDLEISTTFQKGSDIYKVTRYQAHSVYGNSLELLKNGVKDPNAPKKINLLEQYIQELMGQSLKEYHHFTHVPQKAFSTLIHGTPSERYQFISDLFQLYIYDEVWYKIDERHQVVIQKMSNLYETEVQLNQLKGKLDSSVDEEYLIDLLTCHEQLMDYASEYKNDIYSRLDQIKSNQRITGIIKSCFSSYQNLTYSLNEVSMKLVGEFDFQRIDFGDTNTLDLEIMAVNRYIGAISDSINNCARELNNIQKYSDIQKQLQGLVVNGDKKSIESEIEDLQNLIKSNEKDKALKNKKDALKEKLKTNQYEGSLKEVEEKIKEITSNIAVYKNEIAIMKKTDINKLKELSSLSVCDKCGSPIDKDKMNIQLQEIQTRIKEKTDLLNIAETELSKITVLRLKLIERDDLTRQINELPDYDILSDEDIKELQDQKTNLKKDLDKLAEISFLKNALLSLPVINRPITDLISEIDKKKIDLDLKKKLLDDYRTNLFTLQAHFKILPKDYANYDLNVDYTYEIDKLEKVYKEIADVYIKASVETDKIRCQLADIEAIKMEIESLEEKVKEKIELNKQDRVYKALKKAYDKKGLKLDKIRQILKAAQVVLPTYTRLFFNNLIFETDPEDNDVKFTVTQTSKNGNKISYDASKISGGEECRLIMSLVCTFHEINNESKRSNILILDEIDHFVDDVGAAIFYNEIIPIIRNKFESIFIISHTTELLGRVYDKTLLIEKRNGCSKIKFM